MSTDERHEAKPEARRKLGRGLSALLGEARREEPLIAPGRESRPSVVPFTPLTRPATVWPIVPSPQSNRTRSSRVGDSTTSRSPSSRRRLPRAALSSRLSFVRSRAGATSWSPANAAGAPLRRRNSMKFQR
jgi:hypothetical protein